MFWILSIFSLPGFALSIPLLRGKGGSLIAGYNAASPEEKAKWNEPALCRGVGVLLLAILFCMEAVLAGAVLGNKSLIWGSLGLVAALTGAGLVYLNNSPRFRKK